MPASLEITPGSVWELVTQQELGSGGYGKVVRARNKTANGPAECAAKIISLSRMKLSAIEKEIKLMEKLRHHNIICLLNYERREQDKKMIIYMELAEKGELFSKVIDAGTLKEDDAKSCFKQLMSAVKYMHSNRVVHRDLKLENVLLDAHNECKVCDFGLAHTYEADMKLDMKLREICGSKSYCAPEVLSGNPDGYEGFPTDVWSCGICLFAMLAGFFPLDEASPQDWRFARVKMASESKGSKGECSAIQTIFAFYDRACSLSEEVQQLIDDMLTINPAHRITVDTVLTSPWLDNHQKAPNYRKIVGSATTQEELAKEFAKMYAAEDGGVQGGVQRPTYRGGIKAVKLTKEEQADWSTRPRLGKQKQIFNKQIFDTKYHEKDYEADL